MGDDNRPAIIVRDGRIVGTRVRSAVSGTPPDGEYVLVERAQANPFAGIFGNLRRTPDSETPEAPEGRRKVDVIVDERPLRRADDHAPYPPVEGAPEEGSDG